MRNIFFFDSMLTPKIITFLYWLLSAIMIIAGIFSLLSPYVPWWNGLLMIILGPVIVRIYAELIMVLFKINSNLQEMNDRQKN